MVFAKKSSRLKYIRNTISFSSVDYVNKERKRKYHSQISLICERKRIQETRKRIVLLETIFRKLTQEIGEVSIFVQNGNNEVTKHFLFIPYEKMWKETATFEEDGKSDNVNQHAQCDDRDAEHGAHLITFGVMYTCVPN